MLTSFFVLSVIVAVLLALACVYMASNFDTNWKIFKDKHYLICRNVLLVSSLSLVFYSFYVCREIRHGNDLSDFRYETTYESVTYKVDTIDILKEKDKGSKYILSINGDCVTISEDVYYQYIGDDNNAVTIKRASMTIYEGIVYPFGIKTKFITKNRRLRLICQEKISYPWDKDIIPYTEEDIRKATLSYINGDLHSNGRCNPLSESQAKELKIISFEE